MAPIAHLARKTGGMRCALPPYGVGDGGQKFFAELFFKKATACF
jgi:hypothetical protein